MNRRAIVSLTALGAYALAPDAVARTVTDTASGASAEAIQLATEEVDATGDGSRVIYGPDFFAAYELQTAEDMLRRIPGVSAILADLGRNSQDRGFGSGGDQVLVDGRRFPGKSNEITKILARLRADSVLRVELIRGNVADIDVRSDGVVVNLVLVEGASLGGGGTFEINARASEDRFLGIDGIVSYSGSTGALGWSAGVERQKISPDSQGPNRWSARTRDESVFYPDGTVYETKPEDWTRRLEKWILTGGLVYDFPDGGRAQLNGYYQFLDFDEDAVIDLDRYDTDGTLIYSATGERFGRVRKFNITEISAEYARALGSGDLTALAIANHKTVPRVDYRRRTDDTGSFDLSSNSKESRSAEYIGRVQYAFPLTGRLTSNLGGEVSYNSLDQDIETEVDLDGDGTLDLAPNPAAFARVTEWRGEGFAEFNWSAADGLSLASAVNVEYSTLSSNSPFNPGRSLTYVKPRLDMRYAVTPLSQARLLIERQVSQLDFDNFVPSYDVLNDRVDAGNPGLLPERIWHFEIGFEQRLAGDAGVLELRAWHDAIDGAIDAYPLIQGDTIVAASGNLGSAWERGLEGKASLRLIPLGLRDAVLTLRGELKDSEVTDPFTGEPRRLSSDRHHEIDIGFRHDLPALGMSYGFDFEENGRALVQSDLFSRDYFRIGSQLSTFAEIRLTDALTLRGEAQNLLGGKEYRSRTIFAINQIDGEVVRLRSFTEVRDRRFALKLKGNF